MWPQERLGGGISNSRIGRCLKAPGERQWGWESVSKGFQGPEWSQEETWGGLWTWTLEAGGPCSLKTREERVLRVVGPGIRGGVGSRRVKVAKSGNQVE